MSDLIASWVLPHVMASHAGIAVLSLVSGFALRHKIDSVVLFILGFVPPEKIKAWIDKADAMAKSEVDKVAAQPKP